MDDNGRIEITFAVYVSEDTRRYEDLVIRQLIKNIAYKYYPNYSQTELVQILREEADHIEQNANRKTKADA